VPDEIENGKLKIEKSAGADSFAARLQPPVISFNFQFSIFNSSPLEARIA
jgi:hypothetical protein